MRGFEERYRSAAAIPSLRAQDRGGALGRADVRAQGAKASKAGVFTAGRTVSSA